MITPQLLDNLRPDLVAALQDVEDKHNIKFDIGTMRYGTDNARCTLNFEYVDPSQPTLSKEAKAKKIWDYNCWRIGAKPTDFGRYVVIRASRYEIVGFKPKARKNNVLVQSGGGTTYVMNGGEVARQLREGAQS